MAELCRFDELRMKTDQQLVQLANKGLELGIRCARQALRSADTGMSAEGYYHRAKRAYAEASFLISLAGEISQDERSRCEARLEHLKEMLQGLSVLASTPAPAGDNIPVLARALWKARGCPEGSPEDDWFRAERIFSTSRRAASWTTTGLAC